MTGEVKWLKYTTFWLRIAAIVAKRNIAKKWGANRPPDIRELEEDLDWCSGDEKVTYKARGCPNKGDKIWGPWRTYRGY